MEVRNEKRGNRSLPRNGHPTYVVNGQVDYRVPSINKKNKTENMSVKRWQHGLAMIANLRASE